MADGRQLTVEWSAAPDDSTSLVTLGLLPQRQVFVFDEEGDPVSGPEPTGEQADRLARSEILQGYIAEQVEVRQTGEPCPDTSALVDQGVTVTATCPAPVRRAEVEIGLLTDLHPAYRMVARATGATPANAAYTREERTHTFTFNATDEPAGGAWPQGVLGGGALAVVSLLRVLDV